MLNRILPKILSVLIIAAFLLNDISFAANEIRPYVPADTLAVPNQTQNDVRVVGTDNGGLDVIDGPSTKEGYRREGIFLLVGEQIIKAQKVFGEKATPAVIAMYLQRNMTCEDLVLFNLSEMYREKDSICIPYREAEDGPEVTWRFYRDGSGFQGSPDERSFDAGEETIFMAPVDAAVVGSAEGTARRPVFSQDDEERMEQKADEIRRAVEAKYNETARLGSFWKDLNPVFNPVEFGNVFARFYPRANGEALEVMRRVLMRMGQSSWVDVFEGVYIKGLREWSVRDTKGLAGKMASTEVAAALPMKKIPSISLELIDYSIGEIPPEEIIDLRRGAHMVNSWVHDGVAIDGNMAVFIKSIVNLHDSAAQTVKSKTMLARMGPYRTFSVRSFVRPLSYPDPDDVQMLMVAFAVEVTRNQEFKEMHPIMQAATVYQKISDIQPFGDGNKRTAKLLMDYFLMRNHYPPLEVTAENREEFIRVVRFMKGPEELADFLAEELQKQCERYKQQEQAFSRIASPQETEEKHLTILEDKEVVFDELAAEFRDALKASDEPVILLSTDNVVMEFCASKLVFLANLSKDNPWHLDLSRCTVVLADEMAHAETKFARFFLDTMTRLPAGNNFRNVIRFKIGSGNNSKAMNDFTEELGALPRLSLAIVGLRSDGRIAGNERLTSFASKTRMVRHHTVYGSFTGTQDLAFTAGMEEIMKAERVVVTAISDPMQDFTGSGYHISKAFAVKEAINTMNSPASAARTHASGNFMFIVDKKSAGADFAQGYYDENGGFRKLEIREVSGRGKEDMVLGEKTPTISVKVETSIPPEELEVQAWTDMIEGFHAQKEWHPIPLSYTGQQKEGAYIFEGKALPTQEGVYRYTIRMAPRKRPVMVNWSEEWVWWNGGDKRVRVVGSPDEMRSASERHDAPEGDAPAIALFRVGDHRWVYQNMDSDMHTAINLAWYDLWGPTYEMPQDSFVVKDLKAQLGRDLAQYPIHVTSPPEDILYDKIYGIAEAMGTEMPARGKFRLVTHAGTFRGADGPRSMNLLIPREELAFLKKLRQDDPDAYVSWLEHEAEHLIDRAAHPRGLEHNEDHIREEKPIAGFLDACNAWEFSILTLGSGEDGEVTPADILRQIKRLYVDNIRIRTDAACRLGEMAGAGCLLKDGRLLRTALDELLKAAEEDDPVVANEAAEAIVSFSGKFEFTQIEEERLWKLIKNPIGRETLRAIFAKLLAKGSKTSYWFRDSVLTTMADCIFTVGDDRVAEVLVNAIGKFDYFYGGDHHDNLIYTLRMLGAAAFGDGTEARPAGRGAKQHLGVRARREAMTQLASLFARMAEKACERVINRAGGKREKQSLTSMYRQQRIKFLSILNPNSSLWSPSTLLRGQAIASVKIISEKFLEVVGRISVFRKGLPGSGKGIPGTDRELRRFKEELLERLELFLNRERDPAIKRSILRLITEFMVPGHRTYETLTPCVFDADAADSARSAVSTAVSASAARAILASEDPEARKVIEKVASFDSDLGRALRHLLDEAERNGGRETIVPAGAFAGSLPDGSPYRVMLILEKQFPRRWVFPEEVMEHTRGKKKGTHLHIDTVNRDLATLASFGLVAMKVRHTPSGDEKSYMLEPLSRENAAAAKRILKSLGTRPKAAAKKKARAEIMAIIEKDRGARTKDLEFAGRSITGVYRSVKAFNEEEENAGYIYAQFDETGEGAKARELGIRGIYVSPEYRGTGLSGELAEELLRIYPEVTYLHKSVMNPVLIKIAQEKLGFKPVDLQEKNKAYIAPPAKGEKTGRLWIPDAAVRTDHAFGPTEAMLDEVSVLTSEPEDLQDFTTIYLNTLYAKRPEAGETLAPGIGGRAEKARKANEAATKEKPVFEITLPAGYSKEVMSDASKKINAFIGAKQWLVGGRDEHIRDNLGELALNVMEHGNGGKISIYVGRETGAGRLFRIVAEDNGPGLGPDPNILIAESLKRSEDGQHGFGNKSIIFYPDRVAAEYNGDKWERVGADLTGGPWMENAGTSEVRFGMVITLEYDLAPNKEAEDYLDVVLAEKIHNLSGSAREFLNEAMIRILNNEKGIVGIDTSLIPEDQLEEVEALLADLARLQRRKGFENLIIRHGKGEELAGILLGELDRTGLSPSKVVVLGAEDVLSSAAFDPLRTKGGEEGALFANIALPKDFTPDSYSRLMEMLTVAIKLASGLSMDEITLGGGIYGVEIEQMTKGGPRNFRLIPRAEEFDLGTLKEIYHAQRTIITAA